MLEQIRVLATLISVGGAVSCGVTAPITPEVDLVVQEESIEFAVNPDGDLVRLSLALAIHNRSRRLVEFAPCLMRVEREMSGAWSRVWAPACTLLFEQTPVDPGRTIAHELNVQERRRPGGSMEAWVAPFDGWYRVVVMIEEAGTVAPAAHRVASARFYLAPE